MSLVGLRPHAPIARVLWQLLNATIARYVIRHPVKLGVVGWPHVNGARRHQLRTAGIQHGFFDHRAGSAENEDLGARINRSSPDVVVVNMGMPLQERWIADHRNLIDERLAIASGALVDHVAGVVRSPPRWVASLGLEWAVRLLREPRRLWRRYLLGLLPFAAVVFREKMRTRLARTGVPRQRS